MRAEEMFKNYAVMKKEVAVLKFRISNFRGIDADEIITSMCLSTPQEEKVQTSGPSDKTASTAINYRKVTDRLEDELFDGLLDQYRKKKAELDFFHFGIGRLSGKLPEVIYDMVVEGMDWQSLSEKYGVSHTMIGKYRRKALQEMDVIYSIREKTEAEVMLG